MFVKLSKTKTMYLFTCGTISIQPNSWYNYSCSAKYCQPPYLVWPKKDCPSLPYHWHLNRSYSLANKHNAISNSIQTLQHCFPDFTGPKNANSTVFHKEIRPFQGLFGCNICKYNRFATLKVISNDINIVYWPLVNKTSKYAKTDYSVKLVQHLADVQMISLKSLFLQAIHFQGKISRRLHPIFWDFSRTKAIIQDFSMPRNCKL